MPRQLKGDSFTNRYRITGTLKTLTPLHVGTGEERDDLFSDAQRKRYTERMGRTPAVSTVIKDHRGKPMIPGSTLKGVMRNWLQTVLGPGLNTWAAVHPYHATEFTALSVADRNKRIRDEFSVLELLFGTPLNAGKLEVWDTVCLTADLPYDDHLLNWNLKSLTYIDTSVAINPATGTALDKLLYKTEIVPPGVEFQLTLTAANLSQDELGLILIALQGFNSSIYPLRVGARSGRGYGQLQFTPGPVYRLKQQEIGGWLSSLLSAYDALQPAADGAQPPAAAPTVSADAGYFALPALDEAAQWELISTVQADLRTALGG